MKKSLLIAGLGVISVSVFASPEGLIKLSRIDSSQFKSGMKDISEVQVEESSLPLHLRKRKRVIYVQSDSWPQEKDDSLDSDYIYSFSDMSRTISQQREENIVKDNNSVNSLEDIFEDVLAPYEFGSYQHNLTGY